MPELAASLAKLLIELTAFAPCAWNGKTVFDLANMIIANYWGLRFDELIYVFRKGINGGFPDNSGETKIFGQLQYADLARWLNEYSGEERSTAEAHLRALNKPNEPELPTDPEKLKQTDEMIAGLAKELDLKAKITDQNPTTEAITHESLDRKHYQLVYQLNYNGDLKDEDLLNFLADSVELKWEETLKFLQEEKIKRGL